MSGGIRAEIKVDEPARCQIAQISAAGSTSSYSITKSVDPEEPTHVTEEFMLDAAVPVEVLDLEEDVTKVFTYGSNHVYRFERPQNQGCPCECVEHFDCPVVDVHTTNGALYLVFHASDMAGLQNVIHALRDRFDGVQVQRLLRSQGEPDDHNLVFVDRQQFTARQLEVLETAHEMGYFEHPKGANAGEVADALDIATSTFTEHLSAAQRKLLNAVLGA